MATPTTVDLLRHGEPVGGRRYRGQTDDPLSEKGWAQLWRTVGDQPPWQQLLSSPLSRCRDFAEQLAARYHIPLQVDDRLKEIGFGAWEGHTADELREKDPEILKRFLHDPVKHRPAGAEPVADFAARIGAAWQDALAAHAGRHILVVCHAGTVRAILAAVLSLPLDAMYRIHVESAGLTRIRLDGERPPTLVFHGGTLP